MTLTNRISRNVVAIAERAMIDMPELGALPHAFKSGSASSVYMRDFWREDGCEALYD